MVVPSQTALSVLVAKGQDKSVFFTFSPSSRAQIREIPGYTLMSRSGEMDKQIRMVRIYNIFLVKVGRFLTNNLEAFLGYGLIFYFH
jgi:hypothetical protein